MPKNYSLGLASLSLKAERAKRKSKELNWSQFVTDNPVEFIDRFVLNPMTGEGLELIPEQRRVLEALFARDEEGLLRYDTIVYSAPKKSGKTAIGASIALWQAFRVSGEMYIIGNDLKQADSRMPEFMRYTLEHNPAFRHMFEATRYTVELANGSKIMSIPVDPEGEAGMNPTALFFTEAWGARHDKHEMLWTEAALAPQRVGESFKFVESYAGYKQVSMILWRLYDLLVNKGQVVSDVDPEFYENGTAAGWWCTRRLLPEQRGKRGARYYKSEAQRLVPEEFARQHRNEWADKLTSFIHIGEWDACKGEIPPLERRERMVMAIDASVTGDCTACVTVSRRGNVIYVRDVRIWTPSAKDPIPFGEVEAYVVAKVKGELSTKNPVSPVAYDPYQMEYMRERLERMGIWTEKFSQDSTRLRADKALYDRIMNREIVHDGNPELREHIQNASAKIDTDGSKLRITKADNNSDAKVDAAVALSMAVHIATELNIGGAIK